MAGHLFVLGVLCGSDAFTGGEGRGGCGFIVVWICFDGLCVALGWFVYGGEEAVA